MDVPQWDALADQWLQDQRMVPHNLLNPIHARPTDRHGDDFVRQVAIDRRARRSSTSLHGGRGRSTFKRSAPLTVRPKIAAEAFGSNQQTIPTYKTSSEKWP